MNATQTALEHGPSARVNGRALLLAFAAVLGLLTYFSDTTANANVASRLATAESLVERHTFRIDESPFVSTLDKVSIGGHFYSEKPPLLALLAAAVYWPLHAAGLELRPGPSLVPFAITFVLLGASFLLCAACFHDGLRRAGLGDTAAAWMTAMLACGTLCLPFNTTLNNHGFTASWLFIAFYGLLRANTREGALRQAQGRLRAAPWLWLSGVAFALAIAADYSLAIFFVFFVAGAIARRRQLRGHVLCLALPVALAVGASLAYNHAISGSLRPVQIQPELFRYPGSYWYGGGEHLSGVGFNSAVFTLRYAWRALFGASGFLLYNPLLLVALWMAARRIVKRETLWVEAAVALAASCVFAGYFLVSTTNYSGCSYSIRWFVTFIPLLWFFAAPAMSWRGGRRALLAGVFAVSLVIAVVGVVDPWTCRRPAFTANVERAAARAKVVVGSW
jgi:hypothetical protein